MPDLADEFWSALANTHPGDRVELLPTALTRAALAVIAADGIGLSLIDDRFRVPLGASNGDAVAAERLQFTVGEGPCIQALHDRSEIRVNDADLNRRWPAFYGELRRLTPYRSIAALPLKITATLDGAIDFYFLDPDGAFTVDFGLATAIADEIVDVLRETSTPTVPSTRTVGANVPAWLYSPTAAGRLRTWIAVGVITSALGLAAPEALARMRGYAYAREEDIAAVTDAIIDGTLAANALTL